MARKLTTPPRMERGPLALLIGTALLIATAGPVVRPAAGAARESAKPRTIAKERFVTRPPTPATLPGRGPSVFAERGFFGSPRAGKNSAAAPNMIDSYPRDGDDHVAINAELYFVFDQPTQKSGIFSVADIDSGTTGGALLNLDAPRWSALGDTVFLRPSFPMALGHQHGMRVNAIVGFRAFPADTDTVRTDLPIIFFETFPAARLEAVKQPSSLTLVPETPTPVEIFVRELEGNAVTLTSVQIRMWTDPNVQLPGPTPPTFDAVLPYFTRIPRQGAAALSVPVTVPREVARAAPQGRIALLITYTGTDETGLTVRFETLWNTILAPALTPSLAGNATIRSAVLEWPLPGAVFSAGDTLRPRAVVIGDGTGYFRAVFILDGDVVAIEEGFLESGRPAVVEMRGPLPTRRFGEHRLQFVVESPQNVASQPVTFLSAPPASGLSPRDDIAPVDTAASRLSVESTWLAGARSRFRAEEPSATGWAAWRARYALSASRSLEARVTSRVRFDDPENGRATPEQLLVRYQAHRAEVEWGDFAPALAAGAPLFASPVPRRGAQAVLRHENLGTLEAYTALESRPRSSAGPLREIRSDLYAGRLTRVFLRDRLRASLYGGATHEDPTPGGQETAVRSRLIYGGSAALILARTWTLTADAASVRHRTIAGVEPGRTRTGLRGEATGSIAKITARAEAFRYQPDLATALNPYAIADRRGFAVDLARPVLRWQVFGGYRRERPEDSSLGAPAVTAERMAVGTSFSLNQDSWVTPSLIRIRQTGPQTDFTQIRLATDFTASEVMGGRTTVRFDAGTFEDKKGTNTRRRVLAGSVVSVRRHPGRVTSTISAGIERDENRDLRARDTTIQGALEVRWEASPQRLLVAPFVSYLSRDYELRGTREDRLGGRLQISLLRLPGLGDAALSVQGRAERIRLREPLEDSDTELGVEASLGTRLSILR